MPKKTLKLLQVVILLLFSFFFIPPQVKALENCSPSRYDVTFNPPSPIEARTTFTITFKSKGSDNNFQIGSYKYHLVFRKETNLTGNIPGPEATTSDSSSLVFTVNSQTAPQLNQVGNYRAILYDGDRNSDRQKCQSDPFTLKAPGTSAGNPNPTTNSCTLNSTIDNNKLILSGKGTETSGVYLPYALINSTQISLGIPMAVNPEGAFGSTSYNLLPNYQGGNTTIGVQHSPNTSITCTTIAKLPDTVVKSRRCRTAEEIKKGITNSDEFLPDNQCSTARGDPCGTDKEPGFKTAIGCIHTNPKSLVTDVLKFATGIGGGLAFVMMLFGVFQMLISGGNPQNLQGGKDVLQNAIIGLLFIIFAILIMRIIGIDILAIPGF